MYCSGWNSKDYTNLQVKCHLGAPIEDKPGIREELCVTVAFTCLFDVCVFMYGAVCTFVCMCIHGFAGYMAATCSKR